MFPMVLIDTKSIGDQYVWFSVVSPGQNELRYLYSLLFTSWINPSVAEARIFWENYVNIMLIA